MTILVYFQSACVSEFINEDPCIISMSHLINTRLKGLMNDEFLKAAENILNDGINISANNVIKEIVLENYLTNLKG